MMNNSEKKQLLMVIAATAAVLALFWWLVIRTEQRGIHQAQLKASELRAQAENDKKRAANWEKHAQDSEAASAKLQNLETNLPVGDVFRWQLRMFLRPSAKGIEVIEVEPPNRVEMGLLPLTVDKTYFQEDSTGATSQRVPIKKTFPVPFQTQMFTIKGRATFHDFGRYLADLENQFVNMRVERLELEPALPDGLDTPDANKLLFQVDFLTLSRTSAAHTITR